MKATGKVRPNSRALRQILKSRPDQDAKPVKRGPLARRIRKIRRRLESLPPRLWTFAGALILAGVIGWWGFGQEPKPIKPASPSPRVAGTAGNAVPGRPAAAVTSEDGTTAGQRQAFIKAVRLQPGQPGRADTLRAEVMPAPEAPAGQRYTFQWRVNDRVVEGAAGDTLSLSAFQKKDRIAVTVWPAEEAKDAFAVTSPEVAIHAAEPSLELKIGRPAIKTGEAIELQLVSHGPDSAQLGFDLAPPLVPGMAVDRATGKISWPRQPEQRGTFRFGASVEDDNGTKVTKTFEVTIK